jgi:hypothetical protein
MTTQPEALRLADELQAISKNPWAKHWERCLEAAAELRRLHAVNAELLEALQNIAATAKFAEEFKSDWCAAATGMVRMARAAIARAEGEPK